MLTGYYPSAIDANRNGTPAFSGKAPLVTRSLADAGYVCGLVGKLHLAAAHRRVEPRADDGYSVFRWNHRPVRRDYWPPEADAYRAWVEGRGGDLDSLTGGEVYRVTSHYEVLDPGVPTEFHQTTWCAEEAIEFIRQPPDRPWLLSVNPFAPHPPLDPPASSVRRIDRAALRPPRFRPGDLDTQRALATVDHQTGTAVVPDDYDWRTVVAAYLAQVELIDEQVGRILAALADSGQRDDTLVIFSSDHGEMLGDHGLVLKGCRFYEGAVRVPLIVSWPGVVDGGRRSAALVSLLDLAPTLLEAADVGVPESMHGRSLWPLLRGELADEEHRSFVRCEYHDALDLPHGSHGDMLFDGRHKLSVYHGHETGELYDLEVDPDEFDNLWFDPARQALKTELMRRLFADVVLSHDYGPARVGRF